MNLYEAIYCRKSVRKFQSVPVEPELLDKIRRYTDNVSYLNQSRIIFDLLDYTSLRGRYVGFSRINAPYYIAIYCGEDQASLRNAGYAAEQIVLYLTEKGLGSCYFADVKAGENEKDGMKRFLVIGFGYAEGQLYREAQASHRLSLSALCTFKDEPGEDLKTVLKAAQLAPSSVNSQPWRFVVYADRIYIFAHKELLPQRKHQIALREFNIGIMLSHIMLTVEELWMNMETITEDQFLKKDYKNGEYICTIVFHS